MIFIDSSVFIFAVGRSHPLREEAQNVFFESSEKGTRLVTSAEVLQELLHVYLPVGRIETLDAALHLATKGVDHVIPVTAGEVLFARNLADRYPGLSARDLLHLSVCKIHKVRGIKTFDRDLQAAFEGLR